MQKVITIIIVTIITAGCSISRKGKTGLHDSVYAEEVSLSGILEKNLTARDFYIQKAEIKYIDEGTEVDIIGSVKHRTSNIYLVSLRTRTGIEIARIYISGDTLLINDRINKKLYYGSPGYLEKKYGISVNTLPLVFGDLVVNENNENVVKCNNGESNLITKINTREVRYILDCNERKVRTIKTGDMIEKNPVEIEFRDFIVTQGNNYPGTILLKENADNAQIIIGIKRIEFSSQENLNFIPGSGYEMIMVK